MPDIMKIEFESIGTIHTPFSEPSGMPIQPAGGRDIRGSVELYPEFADGTTDLDGFSHIILLYHLHRSTDYSLKVVPFLDTREHGLFSTRAPRRPNPIGLSIVRLEKVNGATLFISGVDILDGTPLLDIKPYVPQFDAYPDASRGWLEKSRKAVAEKRSDTRFIN
jgi:tRNA-Thr(GGU) m(6)t(6)A37 methyltransferase TsaA